MQQLLHSSQEMAAPMLSTSLHVSGNSAEHCKPPHVRFAQEEAISAAEIAMPNLQSRECVHGGARLRQRFSCVKLAMGAYYAISRYKWEGAGYTMAVKRKVAFQAAIEYISHEWRGRNCSYFFMCIKGASNFGRYMYDSSSPARSRMRRAPPHKPTVKCRRAEVPHKEWNAEQDRAARAREPNPKAVE